MPDVYPKFLVEGNNLIIAKVTFHHQLVQKLSDTTQVKGGGWWRLDRTDENYTWILEGESHDYNKASIEDIKACIKAGNVFTDKYYHRNISHHNFKYNTGSELLDLKS